MNGATWPLQPRAARVFYAVADAWHPDDGAGDAVAALSVVLASPRARRAAEVDLLLLEWSPRLLFASARGFASLPRERRLAWLGRLARSRAGWIRARVAALRALADQSRAGP